MRFFHRFHESLSLRSRLGQYRRRPSRDRLVLLIQPCPSQINWSAARFQSWKWYALLSRRSAEG